MVDGHQTVEQFEYRGLEEHDYSRDPARCESEHVERGFERVADSLPGWCGFCSLSLARRSEPLAAAGLMPS
jgi:hypothetical protein